MLTLKLQFATHTELQAALSRLYPGTDFGAAPPVVAAQTDQKVASPKPQKAEKPVPTPAASEIGTTAPVAPAASETATESLAQSEAPKPAAAAPGPTAEAQTATASTASPAAAVTYEQVAQAITAAVQIDKPKVIAVLAKFKAKRGTDLKPEQYAEFIEALA